MSTPNINDALAHLEDALQALTIEGWACAAQLDTDVEANWQKKPAIQCTLAEELDLLDRAIGRPRPNLIHGVGEAIREAVIALVAAKQSLGAH